MFELLPNKRKGIVIPFLYLLFPGIIIYFPNGMTISRTKRNLNIY
jgi:Mor family transcriptional regulator